MWLHRLRVRCGKLELCPKQNLVTSDNPHLSLLWFSVVSEYVLLSFMSHCHEQVVWEVAYCSFTLCHKYWC